MISVLPTFNAMLNATSAILLVMGHRFIKQGKKTAHRSCMIATFAVSSLFLISYLTYHSIHGVTTFKGEGWIRPVYFAILGTHTILAASVVPLAIITLRWGLKNRFDRHVPIARWTYPIWLYVSVTGVIVYVLLYRIPLG